MTDVLVVGAGIAGLTAAALLAHEGLTVTLLEAHHQSGGCAGTFRRGPYVFDVGATQVAGLEPGGLHSRLFARLGVAPPAATPLDPGCVVDLADGLPPVALWRDPDRWRQERDRQFPGCGGFWALCDRLQRATWAFAERDPILPPRSWWDLAQLVQALDPAVLASGIFAASSVADLLGLTGAAAGAGGHGCGAFWICSCGCIPRNPRIAQRRSTAPPCCPSCRSPAGCGTRWGPCRP